MIELRAVAEGVDFGDGLADGVVEGGRDVVVGVLGGDCLAGGGLNMGQVIGATNAKGEHPVDRIMNSNCLLATLYKKFGIDYHKPYYDNSGRPVPILTDGEPIAELF